MQKFIVIFIDAIGEPERAEEVTAADITAAYLQTIYTHDKSIIITDIKEI